MMTTTIKDMLKTHPDRSNAVGTFAECIEACLECAQACTACADACLGEDVVAEPRDCIRRDLDCSDVCETTARLLSRQPGSTINVVRAHVEACALACATCAAECDRHADMHDHCRLCAQACRRCEQACRVILEILG